MGAETTVSESPQPQTLDNISLPSLGVYMLFDEINEQSSRAACDFLLKANILFPPSNTITMFINSQGGNVTDGWALIDIMETSRIGIQTVGIGEICSMAAMIFVTGDKGKRILSKNSYVMTHQFASVLEGKAHEMMAVRKVHDKLEQQFIQHLVKNSKLNTKQVRDILLRESDTWLEPKECLKYGLCDVVSDPWSQVMGEMQAPKKKLSAKKTSRVRRK